MSAEHDMEIHMAYCAGCDRQVKVVVNPEVLAAGKSPTTQDLICLEHGERCSGQLCPIFGVPSEEMAERYGDLLEKARGRDVS